MDTQTKAVTLVINLGRLEASIHLPAGVTRDILAARVEIVSWLAAVRVLVIPPQRLRHGLRPPKTAARYTLKQIIPVLTL